MSHTPDHTTGSRTARTSEPTSPGNAVVPSVIIFLVLFVLFAAGLYLMSIAFGPDQSTAEHWGYFMGGLVASLISLFGAFTLVPKYLS